MTRDNRVQVYLSDEELMQIKEWSEETDKSISHLCRDAILEYTDHDRTARITESVDGLHDKVDELMDTLKDADAHTHTDKTGMSSSASAVERAREIIRRIQSNHNEVIQDDDVVLAIEDHAGIDDRTIQKYKQLFRKRGLLFEHPGSSPVWTVNSDQWLQWMTDYVRLNGREDAEDVAEQYPASIYTTIDGTLKIELAEDIEQ